MNDPRFHIEILDQDWLEGCSAEEDLCTHGRIKLEIGVQLISAGEEEQEYGISESALALLRTLERDHSLKHPVAERLIFHGCGGLLMMGCPIGIDWSVTHLPGLVSLAHIMRFDTTNEAEAIRFEGLSATIPIADYRRQVIQFAEKAKQPFNNISKTFASEMDQELYEQFWTEYDHLLEQAKAASP